MLAELFVQTLEPLPHQQTFGTNRRIGNIRVNLWRVRITIFAVERNQRVLCIVELHVTLNSIKMLGVSQECFMPQQYNVRM